MFNVFSENLRTFHFFSLLSICQIISNFNDGKEMPHKSDFAISKSWLRQSKAFENYISNVPKV